MLARSILRRGFVPRALRSSFASEAKKKIDASPADLTSAKIEQHMDPPLRAHEPITGILMENESLRGGMGGIASIHMNVDSRIIHGFRWVPTMDLLTHEEVRTDRQSALKSYIEGHNEKVAASIPAILACSRTNVIIDGHHRMSVIRSLGFSLAPVLYIDYGHPDILTSPSGQGPSKQDIIRAGQTGKNMKPKSTAHVVRAGDGTLMPLVTLSPNCSLDPDSTNLVGGWTLKPKMNVTGSKLL